MSQWFDKKRKWWVYKFMYHGKVYRKAGFEDQGTAIIWEAERRKDLRAPPIETPSVSFQELATEYLKWCERRMQRNTTRQKAFVYRNFITYLKGDRPAEGIGKGDVEAFMDSLETPSRANRAMRDIKALYNWAIEREHVKTNPCKRIALLDEPRYRPYIPPAEDIKKVILAADRDLKDFLQCLYHLAARRGEILHLTWEDVNFERRWVRLYTRKRRGGRQEEDYMSMNNTLHGVLEARWKRRDKTTPKVFPWTKDQLNKTMPDLCERAGVTPFGFHAIRHHVASILVDSGKATLKQTQEFLRHRRLNTTELYVHVISQTRKEAAKLLENELENELEKEAEKEKVVNFGLPETKR